MDKKTISRITILIVLAAIIISLYFATQRAESSYVETPEEKIYATEIEVLDKPDEDFEPQVDDTEIKINLEEENKNTYIDKMPQTDPNEESNSLETGNSSTDDDTTSIETTDTVVPEETTTVIPEETVKEETTSEETTSDETTTIVPDETTNNEPDTKDEPDTDIVNPEITEETTETTEPTETTGPEETVKPEETVEPEETEITIPEETTPVEPEVTEPEETSPTVDETTTAPEEQVVKKFVPKGEYSLPDFTIYNEDEKALLELVLSKIAENKDTDKKEEIIDVPFDMDVYSYYKVASYFYVYYGQKRAVDETFDLMSSYDVNSQKRTMQLRMRYDDIRDFERDMESVRAKTDEILMSFNDGTEVEILKQIAEYLKDTIVYTDNYYDVHSAVLEGKSVCNGYALAFNMLANRAGIKTDMCIGEIPAGYHAWNRVTMSDGSQYFYDITFFDGRTANYKYVHSATPLHTTDYLINNYIECWMG